MGAQNLGGRNAHAIEAAGRTLGATDGRLASRRLSDRLHFTGRILTLNNLVHHGGGRRAGTGDQLGAHAVGVHGCCRQGCDGVLVQVAGDGDLGVGVAKRVEQFTHTCRGGDQVAGVQAHAAKLFAREFHAEADRLVHVVGVDEQGGAGAEGTQLRLERFTFAVVQQGERVGAGADGVQAVAQASLQVGGAREAGDNGGACGGDGGAFVGAARTHFEAGAIACGCAHAGGGARHGGVKVQDGQQVGFEDARFGEGAFDLHDGGVGEERFAFCVAADIAAEGEGFEVGEGFFVDDVAGGEEGEFFVVEAEVSEAFEESAGACEDAVAAACGQAAGEDFEDALTVGCAGGECRLEHGQFVVVGEKGSSSHVFIVVGD